jgi:hypothetical protein
MKKVKRVLLVPEDTDRQVMDFLEGTGMTPEDFYVHLVHRLFELPVSVLKAHFTDLYRRIFIK